ncbi:hypothetical protein SAMN05216371_7014 [Streptomyces sp. TLI_053]|uniref:hypothetical protein n=1 Tax=Streptomyces sp. TLI_053 TaxID=1855352 RepID=UPI00087CF7A4|nr:hypothetical protein [Streptomyces sp. TLI_053]SDT82179.1 hypothetical protein SAMN05216371_7014 [Streptomyces sp. TLI_053]
MIRRSARTALATAACGAVLAGGLAACGTVQQLNAADKVSKAFETFGNGKSFSAKLSVDATPAQIEAFGAATGEEIDKDSAAALAAVSLSVAFSADKPLKEIRPSKAAGSGSGAAPAADPSVAASYTLTGKGGAPLLELRQVGGKAYARGDLAGFAKLVGENAAEVEGLAEGLPTALGNALKGQWVSFDTKALGSTGGTGGAGGAGGAATPKPSLDPKAAENLNASLKDILTHDLSFEDKGKQDGKDRITVTAPARKLTEDLLKAVEPLAKDVPSLAKLPKAGPSKVPDRPLALDLYLDGGTLSAVTFDLAQLEEKAGPGTPLPLRIAFGHDTPAVQAPVGATELATEDISGLLGELASAGGGAGGAGGAGGPAAPLTDAQIKELTRDGAMNEEQVRLYNAMGLGYQDIKDLADLKS